ncbi:siderophore-interacting protein [Arthrobacter sp. I2-34]|uniref:Siderophore-interacting protein n=1 Tax=Arthrobacter hankyongi TaxID=2904801 RepID=A0ABS9L9R7_9MICC|nr:siderophore-interacting protein [Arthrobacter hankyongi]MCG2623253.1 siderophore-interacting protein [Arthrobacter hankyongi]
MSAMATDVENIVPVLAFELAVQRVQDLSPHFRRITFTGEGLHRFGVGGPTLDLRIKLMIPALDGTGRALPLPSFGTGSGARSGAAELGGGWYQQWLAMEPARRGVMRTYTVREFRGGPRPELDVDFVLHVDEAGAGGPASSWACRAEPGDAVTVIGPNAAAAKPSPRERTNPYGGIEWRPGLASQVLLAGDETALPAIAAILGQLPPQITGSAILEVPDAADFQDLQTAAEVEIRWLARGRRPHGELLDQAVRTAVAVRAAGAGPGTEPEEVNVDETILWETTGGTSKPFYAWIAGEAAVVRGLRRYLVRDAGIDRRQVAFMGYWRLGKAEL